MSSQFDRASELEQRYRDDALTQQLSQQHEQPYEQEGIRYCVDCHSSMSTARLLAHPHAVRCVSCQQLHE